MPRIPYARPKDMTPEVRAAVEKARPGYGHGSALLAPSRHDGR